MPDDPKSVDLDALRTFYNPHPGFAGAAIPIPVRVRKVAEELDGQSLSLREAINRLEAVGIGEIRVVSDYSYISLMLDGGPKYRSHMFRVICYR